MECRDYPEFVIIKADSVKKIDVIVTMMEKDEYQCAECNEIFKKGWSDKEADKEAEELWGIKNASDKVGKSMVVICDVCFKKFVMFVLKKRDYDKYRRTN